MFGVVPIASQSALSVPQRVLILCHLNFLQLSKVLGRWEQHSFSWPLLVTALAFLVAPAVPCTPGHGEQNWPSPAPQRDA